ncbi:hypothetical protein D3C80_1216040 [compost metagenome]
MDHRVLGVGANLDQQIAMTQRRIQRIIWKARHLLQRFRLVLLQTIASVKERFADRHRYGQIIWGDKRPENARIHRRHARVRRFGCRAACRQKRNTFRQHAEQTFQVRFVAGQRVKGDHHHGRLLWRQNPTLMLAVKRLRFHPRIGGERTRRALRFCRMRYRAAASQRERTSQCPHAFQQSTSGRFRDAVLFFLVHDA